MPMEQFLQNTEMVTLPQEHNTAAEKARADVTHKQVSAASPVVWMTLDESCPLCVSQ